MKRTNKTIVLIIVWIGKWPWYFPYFLYSCKFNSSIDFIILTDNDDIPINISSNIKFIYYSLDDFKKDASDTLGFNVEIEKGYKLCDFKPAYGCIFPELISKYDFWGHCDIDIIFGNIRSFLSNKVLNKYDVISARHDYLTGSFALYKNGLLNNVLFKESKDYRKVYTNTQNFCFDETNFAFKPFEAGFHYSKIITEVESMTHVVKRLDEEKIIKAYFEFQILEGLAGNMLWENGRLIYRNQVEIMFYHLISLKCIYSEELDINKMLPERYRIGKKKIYYR